MILGASLIGEPLSYTVTPTHVDNIQHLTLTRGVFDSLTINDNPEKYPINSAIPKKWEVATIMMGDFDGTTSLGNIDLEVDQLTAMIVKRREIGGNNPSHDWLIIEYEDLSELTFDEKLEEINSFKYDNTNRATATYEYAIVPLIGNDEAITVSGTVESSFDGIYILDREQLWGTIVTDAFINTVRNIEKSYQTTLNNRYPVSSSAAVVNYDSGSATGEFVPFDNNTCELIYDDGVRTEYQKRFMDFLTNYRAKILKSLDGRIWLVDVNPSPSDSAENMYNRRLVTFNWTEIGDVESQSDIYYTRFFDVPKEYWGG